MYGARIDREFKRARTYSYGEYIGVFSQWGIILAAVIILCVLAFATQAHEALSGWKYPNQCCGGSDCWAIPEDAVRETPAGFTLIQSGEFIPRSDAKLSGDERYHLCRWPGPMINCFFYPNRGF